MKTLIIGTKRHADALLTESLFKPVNGRTLSRIRYDTAKYRVDRIFKGREIVTPDHIHALWMERRKDSDGPYQAFFCLTSQP